MEQFFLSSFWVLKVNPTSAAHSIFDWYLKRMSVLPEYSCEGHISTFSSLMGLLRVA